MEVIKKMKVKEISKVSIYKRNTNFVSKYRKIILIHPTKAQL